MWGSFVLSLARLWSLSLLGALASAPLPGPQSSHGAQQAGVDAGRAVYRAQCATCHGLERQGYRPAFPSLADVGERIGDPEIRAILAYGRNRMPPINGLSTEDQNALLAYLHTGDGKALPAHTFAGPGAALYRANCAICHGENLKGIGSAFPSLLGVADRRDREYVLQLLANGRGRMPGFAGRLSGAEIDQVISFLGFSAAEHP